MARKARNTQRNHIDTLMDDLRRPMFNLTMARPLEDDEGTLGKSARTRAQRARVEIYNICRTWYETEVGE